MQNLTISPLSTLPQVRVLGRCAGTDPLTLFWTGSGIELLFTGSELWVELNADYDTMEPWVSVELDGAWISRFAVNPGTQPDVHIPRGRTGAGQACAAAEGRAGDV